MKQLNHPSILKFIGYSPLDFNNKSKSVIVMEYCQNQTLKHIIDLERQSISAPVWEENENESEKIVEEEDENFLFSDLSLSAMLLALLEESFPYKNSKIYNA